MLSYMIPVEEKSQNPRNLSLNLNLQNTTQLHTSSETDSHENDDDMIDESSKLLTIETRDYATNLGNGNLMKNGGGNKTHYNLNITNNNLCNNNLINTNHNNNADFKNDSKMGSEIETDLIVTNEINVNNNDESSISNSDRKIIKMTKLGSKNITLKR